MRILIADDEYYARKAMTKKVLQASPDAEIMGDFENGIQVLEYLEEHPDEIDVVLTDVKMPEMDGLQALKKIKENHPDAKIVMCTAMGQETMVLDAIKSGAKDFIVKPFTPERIAETAQKFLG